MCAANGGGSYTFNLTGFAPGTYYVGGYLYDKVLKTFINSHLSTQISIIPPVFRLTGPVSGTYTPGQPITITWTAANVSPSSVISLCFDQDTKLWNGNELWIEVDKVAAANGSGSYTFNPAGFAPGNYYIGGYMYDKVLKTFTDSHLTKSMSLSADIQNAVAGLSIGNSTASADKKNESAAIDAILQDQTAWL